MARSTIDYFDEETARVDKLINRPMHLTEVPPIYSIRGDGSLPTESYGI
jgi:hypothetical protein